MKRFQNSINNAAPVIALAAAVLVWWLLSAGGAVPAFMLPSPAAVVSAFISDFPTLMLHAAVTLQEALYGLALGIAISFVAASLMDRFLWLRRALYPIIIISQTIPTIAIAPLLVLWMGFGMAPKIAVVVLTTFFPITVGLLDGYGSADPDAVNLLRSMGANRRQIFFHLKFPAALSHFFAGLKVSAAYSVVGAVVAEWLGGFEGLGVYMTRVRKAYSFDKMFAVIFLIIIVSLLLMLAVSALRRAAMPWEAAEKKESSVQ
jgi:ABC-type nitrate/sulfonate/bicarbonate transport system permease component